MYTKNLLTFLLLFQLTSGCTQKNKPVLNNNSITLILITDQMGLTYEDTTTMSVSLLFRNDIYSILSDAKEKNGDSLNVFVKKSDLVQSKTIDDIKEIFQKIKINTYSIDEIGEKETNLIALAALRFQPPEPVEIKTPSSVTTSEFSSKPSLYFSISKSNSISYKIDSLDNKGAYINVPKNDSTTLNNIVATYKSLIEGRISDNIYVVGDPDAGYKPFERIINALKKNNFFKYRLVTNISKAESGLQIPREDHQN